MTGTGNKKVVVDFEGREMGINGKEVLSSST